MFDGSHTVNFEFTIKVNALKWLDITQLIIITSRNTNIPSYNYVARKLNSFEVYCYKARVNRLIFMIIKPNNNMLEVKLH